MGLPGACLTATVLYRNAASGTLRSVSDMFEAKRVPRQPWLCLANAISTRHLVRCPVLFRRKPGMHDSPSDEPRARVFMLNTSVHIAEHF
jgi:hypothetical protein